MQRTTVSPEKTKRNKSYLLLSSSSNDESFFKEKKELDSPLRQIFFEDRNKSEIISLQN